MRVAAAHVDGDQVVWLDAGDATVHPLDLVVFDTDGNRGEATVVVTPEQLLRAVSEVEGVIVQVKARQARRGECRDLPGSDLPPLGTRFSAGNVTGTVMQIDTLGRRVAIKTPEGALTWLAIED